MIRKKMLTPGELVLVGGREAHVIGASDIGEDPLHMVRFLDSGESEMVAMSQCAPPSGGTGETP